MKRASRPQYYGFVMVTVDPELIDGGRGSALDLIRRRLGQGVWPLFFRTSNKRNIDVGARLCFYVGGRRELAGRIVATAIVLGKDLSNGREDIDPEDYLVDLPFVVLRLTAIRWLDKPVHLKCKLERLSICPRNLSKWGVILHGGSRGLSKPDWTVLFSP